MTTQDIVVNVFIAGYVFLTLAWTAPEGAPLRRFIAPFSRWVRWSGLWHSWNMFAPDPLSATRYLVVEIVLRSGAVLLWQAPRVDDQPILRAFRQMRHTKYQSALFQKNQAYLRGPLVQYMLAKYDFADDPPVEVRLVCMQRAVAPEDPSLLTRAFTRHVFHSQQVCVPPSGSRRADPAPEERPS